MVHAVLDTLSTPRSDELDSPNRVVWQEPEAGDPLDPLNHRWIPNAAASNRASESDNKPKSSKPTASAGRTDAP